MKKLRRHAKGATLVLWWVLGSGYWSAAPAAPDLSTADRVAPLHHRLKVRLEPMQQSLSVSDTLSIVGDRWPGGQAGLLEFQLHAGLEPTVQEADVRLETVGPLSPAEPNAGAEPGVTRQRYRLRLPPGRRQATLVYQGKIHHPVRRHAPEHGHAFGVSAGLIDKKGVYLSGASHWYPVIENTSLSFDLSLDLPAAWRAVTQGQRRDRQRHGPRSREQWSMPQPQNEIYLVAGAWHEYRQSGPIAEAWALLRQPQPELAQKYLAATAPYLTMYTELLGPYPYAKFALVENFWETGYGMPSFTLLGPKVIRLPFILHSSYPHEILHNWWGNGVFVDPAQGNWAEGLTTYLADHLIKEQRGRATGYRRTTLQNYTDYVRQQQDFPLTEFRARHDAASQAVGYGKTLMLFHMLRQRVGDEIFINALRNFYQTQRFREAGFSDLQAAFNAVAATDLSEFFQQWTQRAGAPVLQLDNVSAEHNDGKHYLHMRIRQVQDGPAFALDVPLAVHLQGRPQAHETRIRLTTKDQTLRLSVPAPPVWLRVDPQFDVFRRLDRRETPPSFSQVFGAPRALLILPAAAPPALRRAYNALAQQWQSQRPKDLQIRWDDAVSELPTDRSIWLLGSQNRFIATLAQALEGYDFEISKRGFVVSDEVLSLDQHSIAVVGRLPTAPQHALALLAAPHPKPVTGLGRKLPHYGKYSYLGFQGEAPDNTLKGQWPVLDSPLSRAVGPASDHGPAAPPPARLAPRPPLAKLPPRFAQERMLQDIQQLAAPALAGRGLGSAGLDQAAAYIARAMREAGLHAGGDRPGSYLQGWTAQVAAGNGQATKTMRLQNVIGIVPGTDPQRAQQYLIIGAHYDHLGLGWPDVRAGNAGRIHPGADDNASGVAVLLEMARHFVRVPTPRTLVFVAFSGEEAGRLGSEHLLKSSERYTPANTIAMLNLDTVGRLQGKPITVFGVNSATQWPHILRGVSYTTGTELRPAAADAGASDHMSFLNAGIPAIQLFSGAHADYHAPGDQADKIDGPGLVTIATALEPMLTYLGQRPDLLTATIPAHSGLHAQGSTAPMVRRRVRLGTVPDFGYGGPGVRISGVQPDSPAAKAGLQGGDILLALNGTSIADLREFSQTLRRLQAGAQLTIKYSRANQVRTVTTSLVER